MKKIILIVIMILAILLIAYVAISAFVFIFQEINHSLKNVKRAVKHALWDLEWKFKHR